MSTQIKVLLYSVLLPVGPCPLWCQVHPVHTVVVIIHDFGQTKVGDFDFPAGRAIHQQDVALTTKQNKSLPENEWA